MKLLLMKEIKLTAQPMSWFFVAFAAMTMIPGYPILMGAFFVCLGIFYSFQSARECNDILYTALLPVEKRDVVTAKTVFTVFIQLLAFLIAAVLTGLRMGFLQNVRPYAENAMMNANIAYLGYILFLYAVFNLVFLMGFFKTAYNIGKPFIIFCIITFLVVGAAEAVHHIPGLTVLNTTGTDAIGLQLTLLSIGAVLYAAGTLLAWRVSQKRFEKLDI